MLKKFFIILLIFIFTVGIVSAEDNLTEIQQDGPLGDMEFKQASTIQDEINNASDESFIELKGEYWPQDYGEKIIINKSITIEGIDNTTIHGTNAFRIDILKGNVTFKNLNFFDNYDVFIINNGNLTFINCNFKEVNNAVLNNACLEIINSTFGERSGFETSEGSVKITNCLFNSSVTIYDTIYGDSVDICNSTFINNYISIYTYKSRVSKSKISESYFCLYDGVLNVDNNEFLDDIIYIIEKQENLQFINNTFIGCEMNHYTGEGISEKVEFINSNITDSYIVLRFESMNSFNTNLSSTIISNIESMKFDYCSIGDCKIWANDFELDHSSVSRTEMITAGNVYLKNSDFTNISSYEAPYMSDIFSVDNCTFSNSNVEGGLLNLDQKTIRITNSRFINNTCDKSLIHFYEALVKKVSMYNNVFLNNTCSKLIFWHFSFTSYGDPGNIEINASLNFKNNVIMNNLNKDGQYSKIDLDADFTVYDFKMKTPFSFDIDNNFFGFNMDDKVEFDLIPIIELSYEIMSRCGDMKLVNLVLTSNNDEHTLKFMNSANETVILPTTKFHIKDKITGEILVSNITVRDGMATFKLNKTLDEIYILNDGFEIVNKPRAELTYDLVGDSYEDIQLTATVKYNNTALKNEVVRIDAFSDDNRFSGGKIVTTHNVESYETDIDGKVLLYENSHYRETKYYLLDDGDVLKYDVIVSFANKEFGLSQIILNDFKIKKTECILSVSNLETTYLAKSILTLKLTSKKTGKNMKSFVDIYFYKNGKQVEDGSGEIYNGILKYNMPKLNAGTYKVVIMESDWQHTFKTKTITFTVNKLKATVKAPKVKYKYKKSKYFKITVAANKNPVKKVYLNVKIGKKIYKIKTNNKGIVLINTKKLKVGKYNVVISSANANYKISAKSKITIIR